MTRGIALNLALLCAVTALALFAYFRPQGGEPGHKLSALTAAQTTTIRIEIAGSSPITLERTPSGWRLTAPIVARADNFQVQRLLGILDATSKDRFPAVGLARFDLNEPYARVIFNAQSFSFGAANQISREQYVLTEGGVYLVSLAHAAALPKSALQLADKQLFASDEAPAAFELADFNVAQHEGKWRLTPAEDTSADDINRWIDEWRLATALELHPPGNRRPLTTIKVRLRNGAEIALAVLRRDPALVLTRSDQDFEYQFASGVAQRLLTTPGATVSDKKENSSVTEKPK